MVTESRPDGFTRPDSTPARVMPPSSPGKNAWSTAAGAPPPAAAHPHAEWGPPPGRPAGERAATLLSGEKRLEPRGWRRTSADRPADRVGASGQQHHHH